MNSNNLHALIVLRNHAQAILNGTRADLKLTREDKASLMNGLKKVDEVFIKNFENCVEASNVSTKVRSWTSTESEELVLDKALKESDPSVTAVLKGLGADSSTVKQELLSDNLKDNVAVKAASGSEVITVPVVNSDASTDAGATKKSKKGFKRA